MEEEEGAVIVVFPKRMCSESTNMHMMTNTQTHTHKQHTVPNSKHYYCVEVEMLFPLTFFHVLQP